MRNIVRRLHLNSVDILSHSSRQKFLDRFGAPVSPVSDILETERRNHYAVLSNASDLMCLVE